MLYAFWRLSMSDDEGPIIFTPDNEPYLGRAALLQFDQEISAALEQNAITAPASHTLQLTDHQKMACLLLPQSISIALSIRELIRQGYLFGGSVLLRSLVERAAILFYLFLYPDQIGKWNRGWQGSEAPNLSQMLDAIADKQDVPPPLKGRQITAFMNSLLHGKPDSSDWNTIKIAPGQIGIAPSKILDRPDLCDDLCSNAVPWLVVVHAMMGAYFPEMEENKKN
jgi:hypothetical protein